VLSHAAFALTEIAGHEGRAAEAGALERLADHAGKHASRLRATAEDLYLRSAKAGPYDGGRGQAAAGSRIVERDYRTWDGSAALAQADGHTTLWYHAAHLRQSWTEIRRDGLDDGPGPTAIRYYNLARACDALAGNFTADMPSAALGDLLRLAQHTRKHAIRLSATAALAEAGGEATAEQAPGRETAAVSVAYQGLPDSVAAVSASAHAAVPKQEGAERADSGAGRRPRRSLFRAKSAAEQGR